MRYLALPFEMFCWIVRRDVSSKRYIPRDGPVTLADFPNLREIIINMDPTEDPHGEGDLGLIYKQDIARDMKEIAKRHPRWKIPKWRLVRDRASLSNVVERNLLT